MKRTKSLTVFVLIVVGLLVFSCTTENNIAVKEEKVIKISKDLPFIEGKHFKQGTNKDPEGRELGLNNYYLRYDGKAIIPVMGEIHYTRYPREEWEEALLKMKASGINQIAFYCFWLHHEEEEGNIRFDDNRDVRSFIELCAKHGLWAFPRIGPWCHGECRNGGFPDWFVKKHKGAQHRGYNGELDPAVKRWYRALAKQFEGLYFKNGGPIIGVQVDNEVYSTGPGHWGYDYISDLRNYAVEIGIDVPFYTATGWPGQVPEDLMIGLYGAYPAAPWTQHVNKLTPFNSYLFTPGRKDKAIGSDWGFGDIEDTNIPIYRHPFLTVEMGGGNQITYHRRPRLAGKDMIALVYTRLGVGANMIGYYVYHGTQHPLSWHNEYPTQESKTTIHPYPNDYPMISYDFLAPLTEWGFIRDYYHDFKLINHFINNFGNDLAPMYPTIPEDNPTDPADSVNLRYSVRSRGGSGYIFFSNYVRHLNMNDHNNVRFKLQLVEEKLTVPDGDIEIKNGVYGVLPFNYDMQDVVLKYATAHPFMILNNDQTHYCFYTIEGIKPEFKFEKSNIDKIKVRKGKKITVDGFVKVKKIIPGKDCRIEITTTSGENFTILLFTEEEARLSYKFKINGIETLVLTDNLAFYDEKAKELEIRSMGKNEFDFYTYPEIHPSSNAITQTGRTGSFFKYHVALPKCELPEIRFSEVSDHKAYETYCKSLGGKTPKGPKYNIHLFDDKTSNLIYKLDLPKSLPQGVNDVLVEFDYKGNTAQVYADGVIIADDYYSGLKMPFALRRHRDKLAKSKFLFQVTPLMSKYEIYFEEGTELGFANTKHAVLNGISVVPEYTVKIKFK